MTIRKALTSIVLTGLALGGIGCANYREYHFDGKIGKEGVEFYEAEGFQLNALNVTKPDGKKIMYADEYGEDLKLEAVTIKYGEGSFEKTYRQEKVLEKAQKQFDDYLQKIKETKAEEKKRKTAQKLEEKSKEIKKKLEEENKIIKQGLKDLD